MKNENMKDNPSSVKKEKKPLTKKVKIAIIVVSSVVLAAVLAVCGVFINLALQTPNPETENDKYLYFNSKEIIGYTIEVNKVVKIFQEDCGIQLLDPRGQKFSFGKLVLDGNAFIEDYYPAEKVANPIGFNYHLETKDNSAAEAVVNAIATAIGNKYGISAFRRFGFSIAENVPKSAEITIYDDARVCVLQGFSVSGQYAMATYRVVDKERNLSFVLESTISVNAFVKNPETKDLVTREMFKPVFDVLEEIMAFYVKDAYGINIYA